MNSGLERVLVLRKHIDRKTVHELADLRAEVPIDFEVPGHETAIVTVSSVGHKLHDIVGGTPGTTFDASYISRDQLVGLGIEFWHAGFDFEVASDGGLDHGEHKLNCRLDVEVLLYSHDRDEILVVLD